jgi:bifunctional UDP-N-acetylglucosamine pyrophosphorylase/glucosamine-1-phosphate N-acetyltransferase
MRSQRIKVLHTIGGKPMLEHTLRLLPELGVRSTVLVLGHQAQAVRETLEQRRISPPGLRVAIQAEQRGTADAVRCALPELPPDAETAASHVLILYGDTPLLTAERLHLLVAAGQDRGLALLSTRMSDPSGYGRIVRGADGLPQRIVEDRDCNEAQRRIQEVNAGMYVVDSRFLRRALENVRADNAQRELYLTDLVAQAVEQGIGVAVVDAPPEEVMGINDRVDLAQAETALRRRINLGHMRRGVTLRDPASTHIDSDVTIDKDTELGPGVILRGACRIGAGCLIDAGCVLSNVVVADGAHIKPYTVATDSELGAKAQIGPFSHLRPETVVGEGAHIGNFVELKKTRMGPGSKANHLAYLGDAEIGAQVNIGCGTITCNYDGVSKHKTVIEDEVFIGSDTQLVAPVRVGRGAIVAAGTTVTRDVPPGSLTLSRVPQVDKPDYAEALRTRLRRSKGR